VNCVRPIVAAVLLALLVQPALADRQIEVPVLPVEPELRGDLSCPAWVTAATADGFRILGGQEAADAQTTVRVLASREALFVGFVCHEPAMDELVSTMTGRNAQVWADDAVDLMVGPTGAAWMYHLIVNPEGALWDGLHGAANVGGNVDLEGVEIATARGADRWSCEMRLPFAALGAVARPGEVWSVNFGRERKAGSGGISSWATSEGFTDPETLGTMLLIGEGAPERLTILSRGGVAAAYNDRGLNVFEVRAEAPANRDLQVRLTVGTEDESVATRPFTVAAGETEDLALAYEVPAAEETLLSFSAAVDGAEAYATTVRALPAASPEPRTWVVEDPLFRELLGEEPPGLARDGALMWTHLFNARVLRATAVRFGIEYVYEDAFGTFAENSLIPLGGSAAGERGEFYERFGIKYLSYLRAPRDAAWVLDPDALEAYFEATELLVSEPHPHLWGVFAGDEVEEQALGQGMDLMADPPEGYDFIHEANADVMERFGGGKWGIPVGRNDRNPYRNIAYYRWINEQMRLRAERLREVVHAHDPSLPIVGTDPIGGVHGYEFSRQGQYYDIFTHQYLPRGKRWRQYLGFLTKVLADLTGSEVWPCVHVENYAFATTPEEAVEEMSQVIRNGGHGFHLYMPDTKFGSRAVGDTRVTSFGSPRRHHTVMNVVKMTTRMPRPVYPETGRAAVFYNDTAIQSDGYRAGRTSWYLTEACYTFLGPIARSWFSFIDVGGVLDDPRPLIERFDLIWIPTAPYQQPEVVDAFEQFVRDGGTLICGDPGAFGNDTIGEDTSQRRADIFGVEVGERIEASGIVPARTWIGWDGAALSLPSAAYELKPVGDVISALAYYDDGSAAVTVHRLGDGAAILWGANPFQFAANEDEQWRALFTDLAEMLGMPTGLDIWRFRYPDSVIWREQTASGKCLTNNRVLWQEEVPRFPDNLDTGGSYRYSVAPDAIPESVAGEEPIEFARGNLTDRHTSIHDEKTEAAWYELYKTRDDRWIVGWETTEPVSVTFDFEGLFTVNQLRLWYMHHGPQVSVEGSEDGAHWTPLGGNSGPDAGADVREMLATLRHDLPVRYVRAIFAERPDDARLTLVEAEVWGRPME
jgi:hypothetical protein